MRLFVIMPSGQSRGGAEEALCQLVAYRQDAKIDHLTVCFLEDGDLPAKVQALGASVRCRPAGRLRQVHRFVDTVWRLTELIRESRCDLVLAWMTKAHIYGAPAAALCGVPSSYFQHGLPDGSAVDRLCRLLPADGALACSQFAAELQQTVTRVPVRAVSAGADLIRFQTAAKVIASNHRERLGITPDRPVVGMVGRLQRWKGMHVFAEALAEVRCRRPDVLGLIVGGRHDLEPDYEGILQTRIAELGLSDHVYLAGKQSDVPAWMAAMDIFVHASEREPFGIVVVEAMAMGKPVIATIPGGPQEILRDGVDGLLVPWGDVGALSQAILRFLEEPLLAHACGAEARQRAQEFSAENFAKRVGEGLRALIERAERASCS